MYLGPQNITGLVAGSLASVSVLVPDDQEVVSVLELRLCLETADYSAVQFTRRCASARVFDNDGKRDRKWQLCESSVGLAW